MPPFAAAAKHHLFDNPTIAAFEWNPDSTPLSSLHSLIITVTTYLSLTFLPLRLRLPPLPAASLRVLSTLHNLCILSVSVMMAVGCSVAVITGLENKREVLCFPVGTVRKGPVFFWAYVFYLSKILEFVDTLLIMLSGSLRRPSFLHVYHHATVVIMCYIWLETAQSLFPVALVTNATVHAVMYSYYLLSGIGIRPRWKRAVTDCQIAQFGFSFLVSGVMLWYHFGSEAGCSGFKGWCFNAVFNASLLYLFLDFHSKNYKAEQGRRHMRKKDD
ncbi:hypothetical protein Droror1_Dr00009237 [Drosera rotundifolia]